MARQPRVRTPAPVQEPIITEIERQEIQKLIGTEGADNLYDQFDFLRTVNSVSDRFVGGGGNDTITSFGGGDVIDAGAGNDIINTSGGTVFIDGGAGIDTARLSFENTTVGLFNNGDAATTATFSDGTRISNVEFVDLQLGSGADTITLGTGSRIFGGGGDDRLSLRGAGTIDGGEGRDVITGSAGDDGLGGGGGTDVIFGNGGNDRIFGGAGNDALNGGAGNDLLDGGAGTDGLTGGAGADSFLISFATQGIDQVSDFSFAAGDRIDASFDIFPDDFDAAFPETAQIVTDPVGQGFLTLSQTAAGVLVALADDPASGLLLRGVNVTDVSADFFI